MRGEKKQKRGRTQFKKSKWFLILLSNLFKIFTKSYRNHLLNKYGRISGKIGMAIRYSLLKSLAKKCGDNVAIYQHCFFLDATKISVGDNVSFQPFCYIDGSGGLSIGDNVSLAHGVSIMTSSHNFEDLNVPIKDQGLSFREVTIEDNVWIGAKATVLYGVTIKEGTIVGCNAVLNKSFPSYTVVAGVPAKVIKGRN